MFRKSSLILFLLFSSYFSFSQDQVNFWYFGTSAGLDFNSGSPVVLSNGAINTNEGTSVASDASGNLLFYTDGVNVYNKTHSLMPNGTGLLGDVSTSQSALIVPRPGSSTLFYIFTLPAEGVGNFCYSVVDLSLAGGNGDVTIKNTVLKGNVTEKMSAVYHCNGTDIWVMIHELGTNGYVAYLVSASGIGAPVISNTGAVHTDVHGQMKFNNAGTRIASAIDTVITVNPLPGTGKGFVDLCNFDNSNGVVSAPKRLTFNQQRAYGIEFSQDNSKLYVTHYDVAASSFLSQFDLSVPNIQNSQVVLFTSFNPDLYGLQIGPDYKVYVTREVTPFLGVINSPNTAGLACNYVDNAINLDPGANGVTCMLGLPGFITSYFYSTFPVLPSCVVSITADFLNSDTTFCKGSCISFTDISTINTGSLTSWNWTFQGATPSVSAVKNPSPVCFPSAGTFTVMLISSNGTVSDTMIKTVFVGAPSLTVSQDITIVAGTSTTLNASGNSVTYTWTPAAGLSSLNISNPVASPSITTVYSVTGTDINNCTETNMVTVYVVTVEIPCGDLFVPTAFSPNGDGENDLQCVMGSCIAELQFAIYDRWGEKVFGTNDQAKCWDGQYHGKLMDTGVFVYFIKATLKSGELISKKGNIHLIR